jgi:hexosaminidase
MKPTPLLVPVKRLTPRRGAFRWPAAAVLASPTTADLVPLGQLAGDLAALGVRARIERNAFGPATLRIRREPTAKRAGGARAGKPPAAPRVGAGTHPTDPSSIAREAYRLTIGPEGVEVAASGDAGAYYAIQTLRDLVAAHGRRIPACAIEDAPDFARRGVYHDCSRGKVPTVETLKGLIEHLARWKVNELQLYVENVFRFRRHPDIGRGYSPFAAEDLLEVQDHARRHHVRLVGSLASFGHMEKILQLPAYRHLGEKAGGGGWPGGTTLCPTDPGAIRLVADLYEEFLPLFEAEDFNVCGDEPWELGQGRSRRLAARVGVGRLYLDFLRKIHALCLRHGKRMNAWADIVLDHADLLGAWPKDIVMLNWEYAPEGGRIPRSREIARAGLPLVVCPGTNAWNSHGCRLDMGMRNIRRFAAEGLRRGAEGLLNTDWGDNGHRNPLAVSLHNFAYGAACGWNLRAAADPAFARGFTEAFARQTFGARDGRLAAAIRTLGGASEALNLGDSNNTVLCDVFLGPARRFLAPDAWQGKRLDAVAAADLAAHRRALGALRGPAPDRRAGRFLAHRLEEYALAARLDALACARAAVLKDLRAGRTPRAGDVRHLAAETDEAARELERVWLLANRPSRLRDNLRGMRQAAAEYRRMMR